MKFRLNNTDYIDSSQPIDISIPMSPNENSVRAWYCDPLELKPVMTDRFIGDVNQGGAVNFRNLFMNPHAHGTHTECVGHISKEFYSINQCLKEFHFKGLLVSVDPEAQINNEYNQEDFIITRELLSAALEKHQQQLEDVKVLIVRTLPNSPNKLSNNYSNTNPCYFSKTAVELINEFGFTHLMVDLPSIDREEDGGELIGHHTFWEYPENTQTQKTITELIFVPNEIKDGNYLVNIQITALENDASPSKITLYDIKS